MKLTALDQEEIDQRVNRGALLSLTLLFTSIEVFAEPPPPSKKPDTIQFDTSVLEQRGLDPKLADYFAQAPRFQHGLQRIELTVNGNRRGSLELNFDEQGEPCFDAAALTAANLKTPRDGPGNGHCFDLLQAYPVASQELHPGKYQVDLILPGEALEPDLPSPGDFTRGGSAALLNYNLLYSNNQQRGDNNDFLTVDTELGFNINDWLVRSRQTYVNQAGLERTQHLYAYAQRSFPEQKALLQTGQIFIANSLFGGQAILGSQWLPEASLLRTSGGGVQVEGIALSNARVEIRQNNALIHSTIVPPGPFALSDLPLLNGSSDLEVRVIETDGQTQTFTVPAANLGSRAWQITPGPAFAAGKLIRYGDDDDSDLFLATGTTSWKLAKDTQLNAGLLLASQYQGLAWGLDHAFTPTTAVALRQLTATASEYQSRGRRTSASLSTQLSPTVSLNVVGSTQTRGYRELGESPPTEREHLPADSRTQQSISTSLSWLGGDTGIWRFGYSKSRPFDALPTERLTGTWSKSFKDINVSVTLEHSPGYKNERGRGDAAYVSVNFPLGGHSVRSYASRNGDRSRVGVSSNERVNDYLGYRVQAEQDLGERRTDLSFSTSVLARYTQANLGVGSRGADSRSYNASLRGGIVAHADGLTASPYALGQTFGILTVAGVPGVKISTPHGPVWTDAAGRAVAPSLADYQANRLEVITRSLPRNVDINNAYKEINAGRGSVNHVNFTAVTARRLLLTATEPNGQPLGKGASVADEHDNYITTVVGDGQIFLQSANLPTRLTSQTLAGKPCWLDFQPAAEPDLVSYFESLEAICRPFSGDAP